MTDTGAPITPVNANESLLPVDGVYIHYTGFPRSCKIIMMRQAFPGPNVLRKDLELLH